MELSRKALELLREASRTPLALHHREPSHRKPAEDFIARPDGRGATFQKKTLDSLLKAGLLEETGEHVFVASPSGMQVLR